MTRTALTADTTFYVRTDGNDSNNGLTDSSTGAFLTMQAAYKAVSENYDFGPYSATIQVRDGTYSAGINIFHTSAGGPCMAMSPIKIVGNITTPSNVVISTGSLPCFSATFGTMMVMGGFKLQSTSASGFYISGGGRLDILGPMEYGACGQYHKHANMAGVIVDAYSSYKISGSAQAHIMASKQSCVEANQPAITITNSPTFPLGFVCAMSSYILHNGSTFSGSLGTGQSPRYSGYYYGVVDSGSAGPNYFPGNSSGTLSNSIYI